MTQRIVIMGVAGCGKSSVGGQPVAQIADAFLFDSTGAMP